MAPIIIDHSPIPGLAEGMASVGAAFKEANEAKRQELLDRLAEAEDKRRQEAWEFAKQDREKEGAIGPAQAFLTQQQQMQQAGVTGGGVEQAGKALGAAGGVLGGPMGMAAKGIGGELEKYKNVRMKQAQDLFSALPSKWQGEAWEAFREELKGEIGEAAKQSLASRIRKFMERGTAMVLPGGEQVDMSDRFQGMLDALEQGGDLGAIEQAFNSIQDIWQKNDIELRQRTRRANAAMKFMADQEARGEPVHPDMDELLAQFERGDLTKEEFDAQLPLAKNGQITAQRQMQAMQLENAKLAQENARLAIEARKADIARTKAATFRDSPFGMMMDAGLRGAREKMLLGERAKLGLGSGSRAGGGAMTPLQMSQIHENVANVLKSEFPFGRDESNASEYDARRDQLLQDIGVQSPSAKMPKEDQFRIRVLSGEFKTREEMFEAAKKAGVDLSKRSSMADEAPPPAEEGGKQQVVPDEARESMRAQIADIRSKIEALESGDLEVSLSEYGDEAKRLLEGVGEAFIEGGKATPAGKRVRQAAKAVEDAIDLGMEPYRYVGRKVEKAVGAAKKALTPSPEARKKKLLEELKALEDALGSTGE